MNPACKPQLNLTHLASPLSVNVPIACPRVNLPPMPCPCWKKIDFCPYPNQPWQTNLPTKTYIKISWIQKKMNLKGKYVDKYSRNIPVRAIRLLKCNLTAIKFDLDKLTVDCSKSSMTYSERHALGNLVCNKWIVISKVDEGDTTVIMATSQYLKPVYKQLDNGKKKHTNDLKIQHKKLQNALSST